MPLIKEIDNVVPKLKNAFMGTMVNLKVQNSCYFKDDRDKNERQKLGSCQFQKPFTVDCYAKT